MIETAETVQPSSDAASADAGDWPLRPWALAALLGTAGLAIHFASGGNGPDTTVPWRAALTGFLFFGSLLLAFTIEPARRREPAIFAAGAGLVMAGLAWRAVAGQDTYAGTEYGFMAGVIAAGLALPLFQAGFHRTRFATPYRAVHRHVWSDAISAAGALAFTGASWLLLLILSELFALLKIELVRDLMKEGWFGWAWSGAAFGAALGVLRNELAILGTLQRVVMIVLSILGAPLAAGLALFLVAMIVSGPDVLWQATRSATPVLLLCAAGAWVLANAILRDSDAEMSRNPVLRGAALVLALSVLPLTVFAAISLGTRVAQHGLSPERLWGLIAIAVACLYGLAWAVAIVRGRRAGAWRENVRRANLHLAVVISAVALFLALPILDFGAISTRQQVARLESGRVSAEDFDYTALRWEFGDAGRRALARLERSGRPAVARLAREAREQTQRTWGGYPNPGEVDLRVVPADPALERLVKDYLRANPWPCASTCIAYQIEVLSGGRRRVAIIQGSGYVDVTLPTTRPYVETARPSSAVTLRPDSAIAVRRIERRYITVDGVPIGQPLEDRASPLEGPPRRR